MNNSITLFFLMGSLVMLAAPFANMNTFSSAMALEENSDQQYDDNSKKYEDYTDNYRVNSSYQSNYENGYGYNDDNTYNEDYRDKDKNKSPQIFPANKVSELGDRWWQWITGVNTATEVNPFKDVGQEGCDIGLQDNGKFLFLVGSAKNVTAFPETGFPEHECGIPQGTSILFPIVNVLCDNLEAPPFFGENETDQRICANNLLDKAFDLHAEIDGYEVKDPEQYRIDSPSGGFNFTAVQNNPVFIPAGNGTGVSDGFWILLKPLKPGDHTITFSGKLDFRDVSNITMIFEFGATYFLEVQSHEKSYYPEQNYPEQNYPEQNYPEQNYPEQNYPEQNYPEQNYPEQTYAEEYYPEEYYAEEYYAEEYYPEEYYSEEDQQDDPPY
jgi:hypothetical protein